MRLSHLLFAASMALLLIVAASFFLSPSLRPAAEAHPDYESLERTVTGSGGTLGWGYAMGLGTLATMGVSIVLGVRRRGESGKLGRWLAAGFVFLSLIFTALVLSYARYAGETGTRLFLGLPRPTAWMLYGAWLFPFLMIVACMFHFDAYLSGEDERKFDELIRRNRSESRDAG